MLALGEGMDTSSSSRFYTFEWELTFPVADVMLDKDASDDDGFASAKSKDMAKVVACEVIDGLLGPGSCKDFVINSSFQGFDDDVARTANAYHLLEITGPVDAALTLEQELLGEKDQVMAAGPEGLKLSGEQYHEALVLIETIRTAIAELRSFTIKQTYTDSTPELEPAFEELDKLTDAVNVLYKLYNV
jgi:hypothetical protein